MPYKEGQPTLIGFLAMPRVTKVANKPFFGEPYIPFGSFMIVCSLLYQNGAILGRARSDKLTILAKIFPTDPGKENSFINELQNKARKRLEEYMKELEKEPTSFRHLFFVLLESKKLGLSLAHIDFKTRLEVCGEKWSLKQAKPYIKMVGLEGIGFGSCFPELTEKMYRYEHESIPMDVWSRWRAAGLDLPEKPAITTLEEQERVVLEMVAAYTSEYYPELLGPLDLRSYLDAEGESLKLGGT